MNTRRGFLQSVGAGLAAAAEAPSPWSRGTLDIHHISTGQGSCTFMICPDATTLMVDCGAYTPPADARQYNIGPKPDGSRRTGEGVARYCARPMRGMGRLEIDTFILTHQHGDHAGDPRFHDPPRSKFGDYRLVGISDVAETIPARRVIDRAYPEYNYPEPLEDPQQLVRNLGANGEVWTGTGEETRQQFPALRTLAVKDYPTENMCSLGFRLSYGKFDYFTDGDMTFDTKYGLQPWGDIETPVAQVAGPVDVAVANHHGYVDATGPEFVKAMRPRCFVINAWDSSHPGMAAINNMLSRDLYPGERDIFATAIKPERKIAIRQLSQSKSDNGHVVVRVCPGGGEFEVLITSNTDESDAVWKRFGPYLSV